TGYRLARLEREPGIAAAAVLEPCRLGKAVDRDQAPVFAAEIALPVVEPRVADVGGAAVWLLGRRVPEGGQTPAGERTAAPAVDLVDDRRRVVRVDGAERRGVAHRALPLRPQALHGFGRRRDRVEVAHGGRQ